MNLSTLFPANFRATQKPAHGSTSGAGLHFRRYYVEVIVPRRAEVCYTARGVLGAVDNTEGASVAEQVDDLAGRSFSAI